MNISQNGINENTWLYFYNIEKTASGRSDKILKLWIKTHSSESRGQENELFTWMTNSNRTLA